MFTERRIERHQLPCYLKVFNRFTGQPIGFLGNVDEEGLMLISNLPLLVGPDFELQIKLPDQVLNLTAACLWCHEDVTPGHYDAGFQLVQAHPEYEQLVVALRDYFSFPMNESA